MSFRDFREDKMQRIDIVMLKEYYRGQNKKNSYFFFKLQSLVKMYRRYKINFGFIYISLRGEFIYIERRIGILLFFNFIV